MSCTVEESREKICPLIQGPYLMRCQGPRCMFWVMETWLDYRDGEYHKLPPEKCVGNCALASIPQQLGSLSYHIGNLYSLFLQRE